MPLSHILNAAVVAVLALGTGAATVTAMRDEQPAVTVPEAPWEASHALDGMVFETSDRIVETGEVLEDRLHFRDGRFQSEMCQDYCDFGWAEYRTWTDADGVIHFTTTTKCPDAPHTVVWIGRVDGDEIDFEGTWTTRRWYWTRTLNAEGAGRTAL